MASRPPSSDDRPAETLAGEDGLADQVVDEVVRRVLVHRDLLEDHLALLLEVGPGRRAHHAADTADGLRQLRVDDARVDGRVLPRGRGVQLGAEAVEDLRDLERRVRSEPRNSRCSMKCESPETRGCSSREPTPTQTPSAVERMPGSRSETTRSPLGNVVSL
jgi:hypothetical protein